MKHHPAAALLAILLTGCAASTTPSELPPQLLVARENHLVEQYAGLRSRRFRELYARLKALPTPELRPLEAGRYTFALVSEEGLPYPRLIRRAEQNGLPETALDFNSVLPRGETLQRITLLRISPDGERVLFGIEDPASGASTLYLSGGQTPLAQGVHDAAWGGTDQIWITLRSGDRAASVEQITLSTGVRRAHLLATDPAAHLSLAGPATAEAVLVHEQGSAGRFYLVENTARALDLPADAQPVDGCLTASQVLIPALSSTGASTLYRISRRGTPERPQRLPDGFLPAAAGCSESSGIITGSLGLQPVVLASRDDQLVVVRLPPGSVTQIIPAIDRQRILLTVEEPGLPRRTLSLDELTAHPESLAGRPSPEIRTVLEEAISRDGTGVPLTLFLPSGGGRPGPVILSAYGAYGQPLQRLDTVERLLLGEGITIAQAHVRGGGELGPAWHQAARGARRGRAIEDLAAAVELLVERGYARAGEIVGRGRSAGGFLLASAGQLLPGHFAGLVLEAPLLDPLAAARSSRRDALEWGSPEDPEIAELYTRIGPRPGPNFPNLLIIHSPADELVPWVSSQRFIEDLRHRGGHIPSVRLLLSPPGESHAGSADGTVRSMTTTLTTATILKLFEEALQKKREME